VAELTGDTLHYFTAGHEFEGYKNFQRLTFLESKIQLMLNPNEEDHQKLEWMIRTMMEGLQALQRGDEQGRQKFIAAHPEVTKLCQGVLKREWNRVKDKIELP
jgi:hemerythrin-like domain-containing protein